MQSINQLCALIIILLFFVSDVKIIHSSALGLNNTNASNGSNASSKIASTGKPVGGSGSGSCSCNCPPTTCTANAGASATSCFASDTLVTLTNHERVPIYQLRLSDEIFTTDGNTIRTTEMMMMLDKNTFSKVMFHTIITASGHSVSLTALHLIPIIQNQGTFNYIPAKEVKAGDIVYVMSDDQVMPSPVIKVIMEMKIGFYAPLTTSGTMFGNGIMTSCFSNVKSHEAAQWYMGPLRWYYWLAKSLSLSKPFGDHNREGVHFIPQIMYEFGRIFRPTTLRLT